MRVISLIPSATEIICALGMKKSLVGLSHECDYPGDIKGLPICTKPRFNTKGNSKEIDSQVDFLIQEALSVFQIHENILRELQPDIIVTQSQCRVCAVSLEDVQSVFEDKFGLNPKIISLEPHYLFEVWKDIYKVADAIEKHKVGQELVIKIQKEINQIKINRKYGQKIGCIEWIKPLMYAGNWVPEMVEIAGGLSIVAKKGVHSSWSDYSTLKESDPDKIILMPCGYDIKKTKNEFNLIKDNDEWCKLRAVRKNNVYIADGNQYFNRPGPRLMDSIKILIEIISEGEISFGYEGKGWIKFDS